MRTLPHLRGESSTPPPVDLAIASLTATQHGLAKTAQLRAAGLTYNGISQRTKRGLLQRRHLGVYSIGPGPLTREAEFFAAVLAGGDEAKLGLLAAAELWQVLRYRAPITIIVPSRRRIRGVEVHRCANLDPRDVTEIEVGRRPDLVLGALYPRLKALKAERLVPSSAIRPDSTCLLSERESSS